MYDKKEEFYFSCVRQDIIALVPKGGNKVLEIGCAAGGTLLELKKTGKASQIIGMDVVDLSQHKALDKFIKGNIEVIDLPYKDYFDVIICADVLEHLVDPWATLAKIKGYLKKDGKIILSVPNFREIKTVVKVIRGDFGYEDFGVLDKTHLRFFAKKNIIDMARGCGLEIERVSTDMSRNRRLLNALTLGLFKDFFVVQYVMSTRKA